MSIQDNITSFVDFFRNQIDFIGQVSLPDTVNADYRVNTVVRYRKVLYVTILDTLSKVGFPNPRHSVRMIGFLRRFSGWESHDRISLPHLKQALEVSTKEEFKKLHDFAFREMTTWQEPGNIIFVTRDPLTDQVRELWPNQTELGSGITIESLQHVNLLYAYRNSLVHEFRVPGQGMEIFSGEEAYYHTVIDMSDPLQTEHWELVYPLDFIKLRCVNSLNNLENHLRENELDPYSFFTSSSYWIEKLY